MRNFLSRSQLGALAAICWLLAVSPCRLLAADAVGSFPPLPPLRIQGTNLTALGQPIALRGVNLGGWLALDPNFCGFDFPDEKSLWSSLTTRLGDAKARAIREAFRTAWIGPQDLKRIKDFGFNHVRVPFYYGLIEDDAKPGEYREDGLKWLDSAVEWSEKNGLYCVLDLHGAPGGQNKEVHSGEKNRNALWSDVAMQKRTMDIWKALAKRYKGRPSIAAFDVLNEPSGAANAKQCVNAQAEIAHAIRAIDPSRLVIVEDGNLGMKIFPKLMGKDKYGIIYSQHHYPTLVSDKPTVDVHEEFLKTKFPAYALDQVHFDQPFYVGEWNVIQETAGGGPMVRRHVEAMDAQTWSWAFWTYKQASKTPVRECWSIVRNGKPIDVPDMEKDSAEEILAKFRQLRSENLVMYKPIEAAFLPKP